MKADIGPGRLWIFDFDGTLSGLVPDRTAARLHPASRELLKELATAPGNRVAVVSSRTLADLVPRVPIPRLYLGGASGLEWRFPDGSRIRPGKEEERVLAGSRDAVLPLLQRISSFPGVELEDKRWSVAVHSRRVPAEALPALSSLVRGLGRVPGIRVFGGPDVAEVVLLPGMGKSFGVRRLCRFLDVDPSRTPLLYAGDDENDAVAMRWVLRKGGIAFCVGKPIRIPGLRIVGSPEDLVRAVRELAFGFPSNEWKGRKVMT